MKMSPQRLMENSLGLEKLNSGAVCAVQFSPSVEVIQKSVPTRQKVPPRAAKEYPPLGFVPVVQVIPSGDAAQLVYWVIQQNAAPFQARSRQTFPALVGVTVRRVQVIPSGDVYTYCDIEARQNTVPLVASAGQRGVASGAPGAVRFVHVDPSAEVDARSVPTAQKTLPFHARADRPAVSVAVVQVIPSVE